MKTSESIKELAAALAKAQSLMHNPTKNKSNPGFKGAKYADLSAIIDAARGPLTAHGLSFTQVPYNTEDKGVGVTTRLMHASGEWIECSYSMLVSKNDAHGIGSAMTYCRRYTLAAIMGLAADDDDDGNAAVALNPPAEAFNLDPVTVTKFEAAQSLEDLEAVWRATSNKIAYQGVKDQAKARIGKGVRSLAEQA